MPIRRRSSSSGSDDNSYRGRSNSSDRRRKSNSPDDRRKSSASGNGRASEADEKHRYGNRRDSSDDSRRGGRRRRHSSGDRYGRNSHSPGSSKENRSHGGRSHGKSKSKGRSKSRRKQPHVPQHQSQRKGVESSATIRVYVNGEEIDKGFEVFVSTKNQPSWYRVLDLISERSPKARPVFHLYTTRGREVTSISELKDGGKYVAIYKLNGQFERCDYGGEKSSQDWQKKHRQTMYKDPTPLDSEESYKIFEYKLEKEKSFRYDDNHSNRRSR